MTETGATEDGGDRPGTRTSVVRVSTDPEGGLPGRGRPTRVGARRPGRDAGLGPEHGPTGLQHRSLTSRGGRRPGQGGPEVRRRRSSPIRDDRRPCGPPTPPAFVSSHTPRPNPPPSVFFPGRYLYPLRASGHSREWRVARRRRPARDPSRRPSHGPRAPRPRSGTTRASRNASAATRTTRYLSTSTSNASDASRKTQWSTSARCMSAKSSRSVSATARRSWTVPLLYVGGTGTGDLR